MPDFYRQWKVEQRDDDPWGLRTASVDVQLMVQERHEWNQTPYIQSGLRYLSFLRWN